MTWERLEPRMVAVSLTWLVPPLGTALLTLLLTGGDPDLAALITLASIAATFVVIAVIFAVRVATTRYRLDGDRVEVRSGLLFRRHRTMPQDRIRSVDVTATVLHRLLRLRVVRINPGSQAESDSRQLVLDGVSVARAESLRRLLDPGDTGGDTTLSMLTWRWLRYAPLSVWGVAGVGAVLGGFFRLLDSLRINPADVGFLRSIWFGLAGLPLGAAIGVPLLVILALGALTSLSTFVESWWGYRLDAVGDALDMRRGLFSTRSVWLDRTRLRGLQISEPQPLRLARGARLNAIAIGLGTHEDRSTSNKSALLPPAPKAEAHRVAAGILGEDPGFLTGLTLAGAPRAALRRRLTWAVSGIALLEAPLVLLGALLTDVLLHIAGISAAILLPLAVAAAVDAHRNLGSGLHGRYLVTRCGTYNRRTVLIDTSAVIGWGIDQSAFQRRAGIATFVAMVGAGRSGYRIRDVRVADGLALARAATPGMLDEFLETAPEENKPVGVR
ncbi:PH domain-containing protein [Actinoplanes sp. CA-252034]|uniref:PH domain-containing protein n=1 Tax=Actinoplanes sp. CA-252034 TaxID=3239906 RepID=UPI003D981311